MPAAALAALRKPIVAAFVLLAAYTALAAAIDLQGTFVSDVGGRVATVRAMDARGDQVPDLGYWAADLDPEGTLHPFGNVFSVGGHWVTVGTVPTLLVSLPLYALGGAALTLLVPMGGAVAAAFGARSLARRLSPESDGWGAYWVVGLLSPLLLYAVEPWDHSVGVALLVWAVVVLIAAPEAGPGVGAAAGGGLLVGLAATVRTEALLYGAVIVALTVLRPLIDRAVPMVARAKRAMVTGVVVVGVASLAILGNQWLESRLLGGSIRSRRAAGYAAGAASDTGERLRAAAVTSFGLEGTDAVAALAVGTVAVLLVALACALATRPRYRRGATGALAAAAALYLLASADGLGFVPGFLAAAPAAAAGLALWWWRRRADWAVAAVALAVVPLVWLTQPTGGVVPVWGGRYLLTSGVLLAVLGVLGLGAVWRPVQVGVIVLAAAVTGFGAVWMIVRTHDIADVGRDLSNRDAVVISRRDQLFSGLGGFWEPGRRWLTAVSPREVAQAARVAEKSGAERVVVVTDPGDGSPPVPGYCRARTERIDFLLDSELVVRTYERCGEGP